MRRFALALFALLPATSALAFDPQPEPPSEARLGAQKLQLNGVCPAGIICCCSGKPRFMIKLKDIRVVSAPIRPRLLLPAR